ncbi:MAG TPA: MFS transporter [Planctomycetota bacterium]|nr:MFS transporter [Planctomycetota bacterium]
MSVPSEPASRREIRAWALYDFANSAFATTILAVIFQRYLTGTGDKGLGAPDSVWGYAVSAATILSAVMLPVLGAVCDYTASKKKWMLRFWLLGVAGSTALFIPVTWPAAVAIFMLALIGFEASTAIYNGFLPEIAPGAESTRVSSFGWAFGYLGGGLHLVVTLVLFTWPHWFGLKGMGPALAALGSVGIWWFIFAIPTFRILRERAVPRPVPEGMTLVGAGFRKVAKTVANIRRYPTLAKFTIAYLLFSDAIQTVIVMSSLFGLKVLGISDREMILCFLMIQFVAAAGAFGLGRLARVIGDKRTLAAGLAVWIAVVIWGALVRSRWEFWALGAVVALVMGGTQAIARSLLSKFTPPSSAAEFFGFYSIVGKFASALGPAMYSVVMDLSRSRGASEGGSFRIASLSVGIFFIAGLVILLRVNESRGVAEAEAEERRLTAGAEGNQVQ